jgi:hypothetical protein
MESSRYGSCPLGFVPTVPGLDDTRRLQMAVRGGDNWRSCLA